MREKGLIRAFSFADRAESLQKTRTEIARRWCVRNAERINRTTVKKLDDSRVRVAFFDRIEKMIELIAEFEIMPSESVNSE